MVLTAVAAGYTLRAARAPVLLHRQQTEEWKGWMQVRPLAFHVVIVFVVILLKQVIYVLSLFHSNEEVVLQGRGGQVCVRLGLGAGAWKCGNGFSCSS